MDGGYRVRTPAWVHCHLFWYIYGQLNLTIDDSWRHNHESLHIFARQKFTKIMKKNLPKKFAQIVCNKNFYTKKMSAKNEIFAQKKILQRKKFFTQYLRFEERRAGVRERKREKTKIS